jgi:hypothetical protein
MMPTDRQIPQIDQTRPECVALDNRIKQRRRSLERFREQLQQTHDLDERDEILRNIDRLNEEIDAFREELAFLGCYNFPVRPGNFLKIVGIEATQSTQYFSYEGTGVGANNSIRFVEQKPLLARVYVRNELPDLVRVMARLSVYEFNPHTLKYDILRRQLGPIHEVTRPGMSTSRRSNIDDTLNFMVSASDCFGNVRLGVLAWVVGHEGDPIYEGDGGYSPVVFIKTRKPIIQCFRYRFTINNPAPAPPTVLAAPSFADCQRTMAFAQRMFPMAGLSIVDRGTSDLSGTALTTRADFDIIRQEAQNSRNTTTPTPEDHDIYLGMISDPGGAVWGNALGGSLGAVVGRDELFAHELGHLLLPGDDHVSDVTCPLNPGIEGLDPNYPDYPNTTQTSGIGEHGVDLGVSPIQWFGPDSPDVMSYCTRKWISPYNYSRAMLHSILNLSASAPSRRAETQKLVISIRVYRDGRIELGRGVHLPGEARPVPVKAPTGFVLELYGADGHLLSSALCGSRSPDRPRHGPYEDFQEVLDWDERAQSVVLVRDGAEAARWQIEEPTRERIVGDLNYQRLTHDNGERAFRVAWSALQRERLSISLRFTPDGGETWLAVATATHEDRVDVDESALPAGEKCRFQLVASTGLRTVVAESDEFSIEPRPRQLAILEPTNGGEMSAGSPAWLVGAAESLLGENGKAIDAFWSSNRDGFLGDGLSVLVPGLSPGRHVLTLTVDDGIGGEATERVVVWARREAAAVGPS